MKATERKPQTDPVLADLRERVELHLLRHIGECHVAYSDAEGWKGKSPEMGPAVDVLVTPPEGERRFAYVSTFGCSLKPLPAPAYRDAGTRKRVEFVLAASQRGDDVADRAALNRAANTVRQFAKLAHIQPITVEPGETVAFSDNPEALHEGSAHVAYAFMAPRIPADGFEHVNLTNGESIQFVAPIPITLEEFDLARQKSPAALSSALLDGGVSEMLDPNRPASRAALRHARGPWWRRLFSRR
jgi:hypothetical protein